MIEGEPAVTTTTHEGATAVHPVGDLDDDSVPALARALTEAGASGAPRTVIDLSRTSFADSSLLHVLLRAQKAHSAAGRTLILAGPLHSAVSRLFDVTGTRPVFHMAENLQIALRC